MGSSVILPPTGQPAKGPDPSFKSATTPNLVSFGFDHISPPSGLYIQRDDILNIGLLSNQVGEIIQGTFRILQPYPQIPGQPDAPPPAGGGASRVGPGVITTDRFTVNYTAALRNNQVTSIQLQEGYLLSLGVQASVALQRGQTSVRITLNRGPGAGIISSVAQVLLSDYLYVGQPAGWPGGRQQQGTESTGFLHSLQVTNPAAGADWTFTVPNQSRMRVTSFNANFTASAAVANRQVTVSVDDGANIYWQHDVAVNITAGQAGSIFGTGTNATTGANPLLLSVVLPPNLNLPAGHRIRSNTVNIQAGDQWSAIWFGVEEWLDQN